MMKDVFGKGTLISVTLQLHWNDNMQLSSPWFYAEIFTMNPRATNDMSNYDNTYGESQKHILSLASLFQV